MLSYAQLAIGQSDTLDITITEIFSEDDESPEFLEECEKERQRATQDIQNGVLKVENYIGLTFEKRDFDFEDFYSNYLISRYRIERKTTGCTSGPGRTCFFDEMNRAIVKKHGLTPDSLYNFAKREYNVFKTLDDEGRKRYIDFDYIYWKVDDRASYEADTKHLQEKLRAKVDFKKFDFSKFGLKGFHTEVVIDEMGHVISCEVVSRNFPPDANDAIQKAVKEIGGWKPAKLYGSKVKSRTGFSFLF